MVSSLRSLSNPNPPRPSRASSFLLPASYVSTHQTMVAPTALELLENLIADLEAKLNLAPCADPVDAQRPEVPKPPPPKPKTNKKQPPKESNDEGEKSGKVSAVATTDDQLPDICKLEFKVGLITKVWVHPEADKLYCEEIDCGEEGGPRQIASGLRMHYSVEEMLGKRVLVVANLKVCRLLIRLSWIALHFRILLVAPFSSRLYDPSLPLPVKFHFLLSWNSAYLS